MKNIGKYNDLYFQSNALLIADVFENFWNMAWNIWTAPCSFS